MRVKKNILFIFILLFIGITFYSIPFILVRFKKLDFAYTVLYSIAKKESYKANSQEEKVVKLYNYIQKHLKKPLKSTSNDIKILGESGKHLLTGHGYCDEQCNTLLSLVSTLNIKGRLIFLYGNDSISHHSVCEIMIDDRYCMFDPFYGITIRDHTGKLVNVKAITANVNLIKQLPKNTGISKNEYQALYTNKHAYKIAKYNQIIQLPTEKRIHSFYTLWYSVFGESNRKRLFAYYYTINHLRYKDQQSVNRLFE